MITVVTLAPYPVPLSSGCHLAPGELATVDRDEYIEKCVNAGKLGVVEVPTPAPKPEPRTSVKEPKESQETE
jgi:hypothetical protein